MPACTSASRKQASCALEAGTSTSTNSPPNRSPCISPHRVKESPRLRDALALVRVHNRGPHCTPNSLGPLERGVDREGLDSWTFQLRS